MILRVEVNGQDLDFQDAGALSLNVIRRAEDLANPVEKRMDFSLRFTLPLTSRNLAVLGVVNDVQELRQWLQKPAFRATVYDDEVIVLDGLLTIMEATARTATVYIVGGGREWASELASLKLNEIPLRPVPFTGTFNPTNPEQSALGISQLHPDFLTPRHNQLFDVAFPLVSYAPFFIPNQWTPGFNIVAGDAYSNGVLFGPLTREVFGSEYYYVPEYGQAGQGMVNFGDLPPAVYVANLLRAMFRRAGFEIASSWLDDPETLKLVMPYVGAGGYQWNWGRLATAIINQPSVSLQIVAPIPGVNNNYFFERPNMGAVINGRIFREFLRLPAIETNYGNRASINNRFQTYNANINQAEATAYRAPVTGWYTVRAELGVAALSYDFTALFPAPVNGGRTYWGITKAQSLVDLIFDETFIDAGVTDLGILPTNPNWENLVFTQQLDGFAYPYAPGPAPTFAFAGGAVEGVVNVGGVDKYLVFLNGGDYLLPWTTFVGGGIPGAPPGWDYQIDLQNVFIEIEHLGTGGHPVIDPQTFTPADVDLQPGKNLPPVDCLTFLRDLIRMFNLYIETDFGRRVVYIEPRPRFYFANFAAEELDDRAALRTGRYSPPEIPRAFSFRWLFDDADVFAPPRRTSGGIDLGAYDYAFNTDATTDVQRVEHDLELFAPTEFRRFSIVEAMPVAGAGGNILTTADFELSRFVEIGNAVLPTLWDTDARAAAQNDAAPVNYAYALRVMKLKALEPTPTSNFGASGITYRYWDMAAAAANMGRDRFTGAADVGTYVRCVFTDDATPPVPTPAVWSLAWGDRFGLYRLNWDRALQELLAGSVVDLEAAIDGHVWGRLVLRRPVLLEGMYFRILEVGPYEAGKKSLTKLRLLRYGG